MGSKEENKLLGYIIEIKREISEMSQAITSSEERSIIDKLLDLRDIFRKKGGFSDEDYTVSFTLISN